MSPWLCQGGVDGVLTLILMGNARLWSKTGIPSWESSEVGRPRTSDLIL